jgi:fructokinase
MNLFCSSENLWGIDLGGTKIEGVILKSADDPQVLFRDRVPTEGDKGYHHIISQIARLVRMMAGAAGYAPVRIGLGTPGTMVPATGLMKNCNLLVLDGNPLKADLEDFLQVEIRIANDANCFALAETQLGVGRDLYPDAEVVFGIIMGTGVGGGVVVNGRVINGFHGLGGEWGHNYLDEAAGKPCYCGKTGCNESILSGPALEQYYFELTGKKRPMKEIAGRAATDAAATQTLDRLFSYFGLALSVIVNILDPDLIVIGGGVGNIDRLYSDGVSQVHKNVFDHAFHAPVVKPSLGDSAGVFGAAFLVAPAKKKVTLSGHGN